jgi:Trk K+ transport system NAD-binding subunit
LGGILIYLVFPDTNGMPLEEIAALFGDAEVVAIYQREIELNPQTNVIIDHHDEKIAQLGETTAASAHLEKHTV